MIKIDIKIVFLILAIFCQFYVEGWWGSSGRRSGGGGSSGRRYSYRAPSTRRNSWWRRTPSSRKPNVRKPVVLIRKPSVRKPSVRRSSWWSRKPGTSQRKGFWLRVSRRKTPNVKKPEVSQRVNKLMQGKSMSQIVAGFEGIEKSVYKDHRGIKTVGVGFNMQQPSARKDFKKYVPGKSFNKVLAGKESLTKKESMSLFKGTLNDKVKTTKRLFPKYNTYPKAVKTALVNGVFRGEFKSTQKTVKYINSGQWDKVANEYLDRKDYRNSKPGKNGGIKTRMDFNAKIFREYAKERKG